MLNNTNFISKESIDNILLANYNSDIFWNKYLSINHKIFIILPFDAAYYKNSNKLYFIFLQLLVIKLLLFNLFELELSDWYL